MVNENLKFNLFKLTKATSWRNSMHEIIPGLFLGPYYVALNSCRNLLLDQGITHIICVREDTEAEFIKPNFLDSAFTYLTLNISDLVTENIIQFFPQVKQFVDGALEKNGKVLIHGNQGTSRSATLVLAYIMEKLGLTPKDAYTFVKERRSCIKPNEGFVSQLLEYEPIYKARRTRECGGESSSIQIRHKRKIDQLTTEVIDVRAAFNSINFNNSTTICLNQFEINCNNRLNLMR